SDGYKRFTKLIVVWCEPAIQLKRLMARDAISEAEARQRMDAQMPQAEKKKYADFLIDTSNGHEDTRRQASEIFGRLSVLAIETSGE
ncbi:MAG TPA: dephospho-CoA kinase, partial [Pyrinomonadaceae bacterium]|nr:dephospho-CoA kinase [Pyrinomonadaceae bacterium]